MSIATAKEKLEQLLQDKCNATYAGREILEIEQERSGRYVKDSRVTGVSPIPVYPHLPESSPWHHDPVPQEEPLNFDISAVEPVGEVSEIAASIERAGVVVASDASSEVGTVDLSPHLDVERARVPPKPLIRRLVR
jgi:hypothetical protein